MRTGIVVVALVVISATPWAQTQSSAPETYADLGDARLWYRDTGGSGVPVVFLHAATGNGLVWEYQLAAFTSAGYRVVTYDRRGFRRSAVEPAGAQPGTDADDLLGLVNHLKLDRFPLVGTAQGGGVAFDFALSFPDRVRSLVIANAGGNVQDADYLELGRRMRPPQFAALPPDVRELGPSYRAANPEGVRRWLELHDLSWPGGVPPRAQPSRNRITFALLETLRVPTLLLTGDADMYTPPSVLRLFTARIKGAESVTVPEVGHSTYWERPEIFNRVVLGFLRKH
jgi:pimeloyl-ACP methyl ester carboxylesterase